ncbi:MAG TPA: hypothetical protein VIO33_24950 [Burkholderiaceae bacterium]
MKTILRYVDQHHREYGVALFLLPALLLPCSVIAMVQAFLWMIA